MEKLFSVEWKIWPNKNDMLKDNALLNFKAGQLYENVPAKTEEHDAFWIRSRLCPSEKICSVPIGNDKIFS
jgi:hypothetical protein